MRRGDTSNIKNALDWMVGCEAFVHKPVALLNASPRAVHAQAALIDTIAVMAAHIVEEACIAVPILGSNLSEDEIVLHPDISVALRTALSAIRAAVVAHTSKQSLLLSGTSKTVSLDLNNTPRNRTDDETH